MGLIIHRQSYIDIWSGTRTFLVLTEIGRVSSTRAGTVEAFLQYREFRITTLNVDPEICHRKTFHVTFWIGRL